MGSAAPVYSVFKAFKEKKESKKAQRASDDRKAAADAEVAADVAKDKDDMEARRRSILSFNTTGPLGLSGGNGQTGRKSLLGN